MIQCPLCPLCDQPPVFVLDGGHQAWCGTDDCRVLTWDAYESRETNLANAGSVTLDEVE